MSQLFCNFKHKIISLIVKYGGGEGTTNTYQRPVFEKGLDSLMTKSAYTPEMDYHCLQMFDQVHTKVPFFYKIVYINCNIFYSSQWGLI